MSILRRTLGYSGVMPIARGAGHVTTQSTEQFRQTYMNEFTRFIQCAYTVLHHPHQ